jgi:2-dehydropantoate 2-reductase
MWNKLLFIAPFSGIGAVTRAPIGVWLSLDDTRDMAMEVMKEVLAVAQARDIALTDDAVEAAMAYLDALPPDSTASMQRDIAEGRPSELEVQNGAAVRLGSEMGVTTPVNRFIYYSLLPQEMKARGQM